MAIERIGYRRLYDAIGCSLVDQTELQVSASMDKLEVSIYLGPRPKLGISVITHAGKFTVPGEVSPVFNVEYKKDASESSYPRKFFTEIICTKQVEVSDDLSKAFKAKEPNAHNELLRLAEKDKDIYRSASDLMAGMIGLRFHKQFVLEIINENFLAMRDEDDWAFTFSSPWLENLEGVSLDSLGAEKLTRAIQAVSKATPTSREIGAPALTWLLRAWAARDSVLKFLALFIPIEMVLSGYGGDPEKEVAKIENIKTIRELIVSQSGLASKQLLEFFNQIAGNLRPSLNERFEQLAKDAKIDGWEADVVAFKRFNSMRNKLLHRGDPNVRLATPISDEEIRHLEDIAERYISWALFGDGVVYPSRWRAQRKKRS
jgi:hypothetical protein